MTIKKAYTNGFQLAIRSPRMIFTLYITNFLLVALFALSFNSALQSAVGNSMLFDNFLKNDNSLVLSDILNNGGEGILAIIGQLRWGLIAYWLLNIFLVGGIIRTFNKQRYSLNMFFGGAGHNFPKLLGLSILITLTHLIVIGLIVFTTSLGIDQFSHKFESERMYVITVAIGFLVYLLIAVILFLASDVSKFYLLLNDSNNFLKAYFKGIGFVFRKFLKIYALYIALLIVPVISFYLFTKINGDIGMNTGVGLLIIFGIQQVFVYIRFGFRVWILGSIFEFYADDLLLNNRIALDKERLSELAAQKADLSKMMIAKVEAETSADDVELEIIPPVSDLEEKTVDTETEETFDYDFEEQKNSENQNDQNDQKDEDFEDNENDYPEKPVG
ncbi:MAG: hypothetical protein KAI79_11055 [Bacteroidales bacterium]|nr:hypothetical protein [Bacteroidales bacterium]